MYTCTFCNRILKDRRTFSLHLTLLEKHNFKNDLEKEQFLTYNIFGKENVEDYIKKYINEEISADFLSKNFDIVKLITLMGIKRSQSEEKKTKRYKENYIKTIKNKYGENYINPSQLDHVKQKKKETVEKNLGISYEEDLANRRKQMKDGFEKYINDEEALSKTKIKYKQTCLERYGVDNVSKIETVRKTHSVRQKQKFKTKTKEELFQITKNARDILIKKSIPHGYSSSHEKRIQKLLIDLNYEFDYNIFLWRYNWDIVLKNKNVIIEIQGDFWHANPKKYKSGDNISILGLVDRIWEKDVLKKTIALENNFRLLCIWESYINSSTDEELKHKILTFINNQEVFCDLNN